MARDNYEKLPRGDDPYHPHYPSVDQDYHQRLYDRAKKIANPFRLGCAKYTPEEEEAIYQYWQEHKKKIK